MESTMKPAIAFLLLLGTSTALAACQGADNWAKPGTNRETMRADLSECQQEARAATAQDTNIDNDIMATRSQDWQRTGTLGAKRSAFNLQDQQHASDIIARCMADKGYAPAS